jgi:hypothetical protein
MPAPGVSAAPRAGRVGGEHRLDLARERRVLVRELREPNRAVGGRDLRQFDEEVKGTASTLDRFLELRSGRRHRRREGGPTDFSA